MRAVALALLLLTGCASPASVEPTAAARPTPRPAASATARPTPGATVIPPSATPGVSTPGSVTVTFRLTLTGAVPNDAAFAWEIHIVGYEGGANYFCQDYVGWPVCESGGTYEEALSVPPGTRLSYWFRRQLDVTGASEEIEAGELTVGMTEQVVSVTYDFPP